MLNPVINSNGTQPHDYGAANKFGFDDPTKWFTQPDVPLLDEHEMTSDNGSPVAAVDRSVLEEIARNNNKKVYETGDPATLILGHTSDDPSAPEKPARGFVVNYKVKPFKRDSQTGRVLYAIYGDYKLRPQNKHLIDDYPRRSVELWWHRKDIDPIAMLGGSSPERDLGAVIRHGRINHVSMTTAPRDGRVLSRGGSTNSQEEVIRFSSRGNRVVETYSIDDPRYRRRYSGDKVHKVMSEFKHGSLHSGSKSGPGVTSRKQAVAIAMNEAGKSRKSKGGGGMNPNRYEESCDDGKMRYEDDLMNTNDPSDGGGNEYDPGDDGTPDDDMDPAPDNSFDAQLGQSKTIKSIQDGMKGLQDGMQQLLQAIGGGGGMGGPPPGMEGEMGGPPGGGMDGEMPPPGGGAPMGGPPPGDDMDQDGVPDEEESRRGMGERPVQMNAMGGSTGMPGPMDGYIPGMNNGRSKGTSKPYSRNGSPMNQTQNRNGRQVQNGRARPNTTPSKVENLEAEVLRLKRQRQEDRMRFARSEAEKIVSDLEREGVQFGDTPEISQKIKSARVEDLTSEILYDEDSANSETPTNYAREHVEEIRLCYKRRRIDPARPAAPSVSKYSRSEVDVTGQKPGETDDEETFEAGLTDQQTVEYANLLARGGKKEEVRKFMRKKFGVG